MIRVGRYLELLLGCLVNPADKSNAYKLFERKKRAIERSKTKEGQ